jgi:hypothetical protein
MRRRKRSPAAMATRIERRRAEGFKNGSAIRPL